MRSRAAIMRRARRGIPNLDLVASSGIGSYRHTAPFVPVLIGDANRAAYIVAAVLRERQRNPGGVSFRSFQVSEIPPVCIPLHAAAAANVKKKSGHCGHPLPKRQILAQSPISLIDILKAALGD